MIIAWFYNYKINNRIIHHFWYLKIEILFIIFYTFWNAPFKSRIPPINVKTILILFNNIRHRWKKYSFNNIDRYIYMYTKYTFLFNLKLLCFCQELNFKLLEISSCIFQGKKKYKYICRFNWMEWRRYIFFYFFLSEPRYSKDSSL